MRYKIICPSALDNTPEINALINEYTKRMDGSVEIRTIPSKTAKSEADAVIKRRQGEKIAEEMKKMSGTYFVALDERGKMLDSIAFARTIADVPVKGFSTICFVIGGALGLPQDIVTACHMSLSLGKMVLPHRLVGLVLVEQLYRAEQINKGHPYHKE